MKRSFDVFSSSCKPKEVDEKKRKYSFSKFLFEDLVEKFIVSTREILDKDFGCFIWDSSIVLSQFFFFSRSKFRNSRILELSAGVGLPSLLFSQMSENSRILTTDLNKPLVLDNLIFEIGLNNIPSTKIEVRSLVWGSLPISLPKFDFVIGSDCFYDEQYYDDLLMTVSFVLHRNRCKFYTTYVIRSEEDSIEMLLKKWKLQGKEIKISGFLNFEKYKNIFSLTSESETSIRSRFNNVLSSIRLYELSPIF